MTKLHLPGSRPGRPCRAWLGGIVLVATLAGAAVHVPIAPARADELPVEDSLRAARDFVPQVEAFLDTLALERERFEVRVNACTGRQGETRGDVYYIWVGLRGVAPGGDAGRILEDVLAGWREAGWEITRYRHLANGGVNIAATEPGTGNGYILDSGFERDPGGYVVGYFNTPCHRSPDEVRFGPIREGLDQT